MRIPISSLLWISREREGTASGEIPLTIRQWINRSRRLLESLGAEWVHLQKKVLPTITYLHFYQAGVHCLALFTLLDSDFSHQELGPRAHPGGGCLHV